MEYIGKGKSCSFRVFPEILSLQSQKGTKNVNKYFGRLWKIFVYDVTKKVQHIVEFYTLEFYMNTLSWWKEHNYHVINLKQKWIPFSDLAEINYM